MTKEVALTEWLLEQIAEDERMLWRFTDLSKARVLAECEAKRRIVELSWHHLGDDDYAWGMEEAKRQIVAVLALPYADRPGYRDEWKP